MRRVHDLDLKDREILSLLEEDGRRPTSDIARITGLSAPTVAERIARLRDIGVIRGFTVKIDESRVGYPMLAIVQFRPASLNDEEAAEFVEQLPEVRDCFMVTGETVFVMTVRLTGNEHLTEFLEHLRKHGETRTGVVLRTEWEQRPMFKATARRPGLESESTKRPQP